MQGSRSRCCRRSWIGSGAGVWVVSLPLEPATSGACWDERVGGSCSTSRRPDLAHDGRSRVSQPSSRWEGRVTMRELEPKGGDFGTRSQRAREPESQRVTRGGGSAETMLPPE